MCNNAILVRNEQLSQLRQILQEDSTLARKSGKAHSFLVLEKIQESMVEPFGGPSTKSTIELKLVLKRGNERKLKWKMFEQLIFWITNTFHYLDFFVIVGSWSNEKVGNSVNLLWNWPKITDKSRKGSCCFLKVNPQHSLSLRRTLSIGMIVSAPIKHTHIPRTPSGRKNSICCMWNGKIQVISRNVRW